MEDLIGGFGLIGWDLVTGLEHTAEAEIAVLTDLASYVRRIDGDIGVASCSEFFGLAVGNIEGDVFTADPVADPVPVSIDQGDFDAIVKDVSEIVEIATADAGTGPVPCGAEGLVDTVRRLCVVDRNTQGGLHPGAVEITLVVVWWERTGIDGCNVVDVSSRVLFVDAFDEFHTVMVSGLAS